MPNRPPVHSMPFLKPVVRRAHIVPDDGLPKRTERVYGTERWKRVRREVLRLAGYRCQRCGACVRKLGQSRVDHIVPFRERPDLAFVLDNLRVLCVGCDAIRHREKGGHHAKASDRDAAAG